MTELNIAVSGRGVREVTARVRTVADSNLAGRLSAGTALVVALLDKTAREIGRSPAEPCAKGCQFIWVRRDQDADTVFEQLPLVVATAVFPLRSFKLIPKWFVPAAKLYFNSLHSLMFWEEATTDKEFMQIAVELLDNADLPWLRFAGWAETGYGTGLISEPEILDSAAIDSLKDFTARCGLQFRILGMCNRHPSENLRVEIVPTFN
jgi:hypothetical protein